ncbi:DUF4856 domain-containing protein [Shimia sp. R9_1]|uniref:DUF4856 domain-containing protein n=1 Tax=Shimia sp. R9_1 TaxID=2821111 RepID=UPI001ADA3FF6|nr:DUF4856 domain-containing protein [Shimia sp. R9_1]MBO9409220.1 DUF4856 domain-containing protein [Shimia sp. R9_1]
MFKTTLKLTTALAVCAAASIASADTYGPFPVTVKGYEGDKTNSVSYSGQIARHALHDSLKKAAGKGNGGANAADVEAMLLAYFNGSDADLEIMAPASKDGYPVKQATVNAISKGKNISGKFYDGAMPAWPGNVSGKEAMLHMIKHAAQSNGGFDAENGYDWGQVISKYTMGAMMYNQAVDNYLDEKLDADNKPNNKPYKDGAYYTGKEHSWDEAFGYWGGPAHTLSLSPEQAYSIAKQKDLTAADANGDGVVDLKSEHVFGPAYYAAGADKGGTKSTNYMHTIMQAFVDGRQLIADANGEALTDDQRAQLKGYAEVIESNWEKVLAEATFKYAGSVYKDIGKMGELEGEELAKAYRNYVKHWGELKGFAMALQTGKNNLGATATELNKLIGFGPVTLDNTYVTGIDADGNFVRERRKTWSDYQLQMLETQKLLADTFGLKSRANDALADLETLAGKLNSADSAETD